MPKPRIDLTGKRFGRLTVIRYYESVNGHPKWECVCDCGRKKIIDGASLRSNGVRSCGCLRTDQGKKQRVHGGEPRRLYRIWGGLRNRCSNPKNPDYRYYGAKGITVCPEWDDFVAFRDWAFANGYQETLSIDRIDNSGSYSPSNCRWATAAEQANNRRNNHKVSYMGETKNVSEWAHQFGIDPCVFHAAIRRGKTVSEILSMQRGESC